MSSSFSVWAEQAKQLASCRVPRHAPSSGASPPPAASGDPACVAGTQTRSATLQIIPEKELQSLSFLHWSTFLWEAMSEHPHQMMLAATSIAPNRR
ncbi:MAG TPA: hypothetical protein VJT73_05965 [Polyangiaceae bacterium]|nr:hypothetical protein [Polyangiaceae bacterium]